MDTQHGDWMADVFRAAYLGRSTGVIERQSHQRLYFRGGELYLEPWHPCAKSVARALANVDSRPAADPELSRRALELARELASTDSLGQLDGSYDDFPGELVGPLPTVLMVMELAVHGCGEPDLSARLGEAGARFQSSTETPALHHLPGLDPGMAGVLTCLAEPATLAQLQSCSGLDRLSVLRSVAKLLAVGLIAEVDEARPELGSRGHEEPDVLLSPRALKCFLERIAEDLGLRALDLAAQEHRAFLAELVSRLGTINYYELLGIEPQADNDEVLASYRRVARRVHPLHVEHLGLQETRGVIQLLFERTTEAYLTLSDPVRRVDYNRSAGVRVEVTVDAEQREREKKSIARQNHRLAMQYMSADSMEFSGAVELLQESIRLDPQPAYYALLGKAQAKNPRWLGDAVTSLRRAVDSEPGNASFRFALGGLLERIEAPDEAKCQYREVLELAPDHHEAREAFERLGGESAARRLIPRFRSKSRRRRATASA